MTLSELIHVGSLCYMARSWVLYKLVVPSTQGTDFLCRQEAKHYKLNERHCNAFNDKIYNVKQFFEVIKHNFWRRTEFFDGSYD